MDWTATGVTIALDSLKGAIKRAGNRVSRRKQKQLISTVVRELLNLDPDIDAVDAALAAAEATGVEPTPEIFRARRMRESVVAYKRKTAGVRVTKKKTAKKATKRRVASERATKKKARKK